MATERDNHSCSRAFKSLPVNLMSPPTPIKRKKKKKKREREKEDGNKKSIDLRHLVLYIYPKSNCKIKGSASN
jgi:hypothetical protein